jgi:multicomponent Na+:H+ antiporter subunit D
MVVVAVPSVVFGLLPAPFLAAHPGDPGSFAPYAASELLKAGGALGVGLLAFALLRGPLARVPAVDVDRVLHPLAAAVATRSAALAIGVGAAGSAVGAALGARLGALVGADPPPEATLRAALTALAAITALALFVAALA